MEISRIIDPHVYYEPRKVAFEIRSESDPRPLRSKMAALFGGAFRRHLGQKIGFIAEICLKSSPRTTSVLYRVLRIVI